MSKPPEIMASGMSRTDADFNLDADADPAFARTPVRFGRLALWVASASALTIGIMGTVAYGVWFNQDQHAYAEAMEHARQTLWLAAVPQPTGVVQPTTASGSVTAPQAPQAPPTPQPRPITVANTAITDLNPLVSSAPLDHRGEAPDSAVPKLAVTHPPRANCSATTTTTTTHRRPVTRVKSNGNVFTRMGSFFHRVSYRQHDTESQRDIYAHP